MSEDTKPRLIVVAIVVMLAVTMVVAGWQYEEEREIEVDEGYDEINVTVPPSQNFRDNESYRVTARSEINDGEGYLEIDVIAGKWIELPKMSRFHLDNHFINIDGQLGSEYNPDRLTVEAQLINSPALERKERRELLRLKYWHSEGSGEEGLETCSLEKMEYSNLGEEAFVYYEVEENNFSVEHLVMDSEHNYNYSLVDEPITIEYRAILEGLQEEVRATARVTYTQEEM